MYTYKHTAQDVFDIQEGQRLVFKERRVFLFQQALVITKQRRDNEGTTYIIKEQFMVLNLIITVANTSDDLLPDPIGGHVIW